MEIAAKALLGFVAALQTYFLVLEMFLWTTPFGLKTFGRPRAEMETTAVMAKNQGLYNGFLAAGLVWGAVTEAFQVRVFFAGCVLIAGVYGALTAERKILFVQGLPALVTLVVVWLAHA